MKSVIAFAALLASGPALAVTIPDANVAINANLYLNQQVGFSDYAGPLRLTVASRTGTAIGLADYGHYKSTMKSRVFSLADGTPLFPSGASTSSSSTDRVNIFDGSAYDLFTAEFRIRVKTTATDRTTGFSGAEGANLASWSFNILDLSSFDSAGISGSVTLRDTPRTAVRSRTFVESYNGSDRTTIVSGALAPTGFQTYSFLTRLRNFNTLQFDAGTSCFTNLASYRINDSVSNSCGVELQLDGITFFDTEGTPLARDATFIRSTSGYDYRLPYFPAPLTGARAFAAAAAVPEPGAWAMMIAGFGVVGAAGRRRRTGKLPISAA